MKNQDVVKNVTEDGFEICVLCSEKADSPVFFSTHIDLRQGYVEGCGQTCTNKELCVRRQRIRRSSFDRKRSS